MNEYTWDDKRCSFLLEWVVDHLRHAVMNAHIGVTVSNRGIDLLPTITGVCKQKNVFFAITAQVKNPLYNNNRSFDCIAHPVVDKVDGVYRFYLEPDVLRWIENYTVSYRNAQQKHVISAPYTLAKLAVYIRCDGAFSTRVAKFGVSSPQKEDPHGEIKVVYKPSLHNVTAAEVYDNRVKEAMDTLYNIKTASLVDDAPVDVSRRACAAFVKAKFFECLNEKVQYENLLNVITEEEFRVFVAKEYRSCRFLHPVVKEAYFEIGVQEFASLIYGEKTHFIESMQ
jgi:hypothetical protein